MPTGDVEVTLRMLVDFAYERGFHELGYDVVSDALRAAESRGRERGIEEAARIVMAMRGEEAAVWADFADATLEVAAGRIRALSGNASASEPSKAIPPSSESLP